MKETKGLNMPPYFVDHNKMVVVVLVEYQTMFCHQNYFLDLFPGYSIYAVWSKKFMDEIIFLIEHDLDPFIGTNTFSDMALAYIEKYHEPIVTHFPVEIDNTIFVAVVLKKDNTVKLLKFSKEVYNLFSAEYHEVFNRKGFVIFGPESNKVNAKRHKLLTTKNLWPNY